jgi:dTDP-4-dehydrorhamnose reductase
MSGSKVLRDGLIVGGDSLIGGYLACASRLAGMSVVATSRRPGSSMLLFDLERPDCGIFEGSHFRWAAICAAITNMWACERALDLTRHVNVENTLALMRRLAEAGTHLVFLSSAQVFDGETPMPDESATVCPKNAYGRQKLEVERAIIDEGLPGVVLRVTKVLGRRPVGAFVQWHENLRKGITAIAATNMSVAPVTGAQVADAVIRLGSHGEQGVWHLSSSDELPYYQAAVHMADMCGLPRDLVLGEAVSETQVPAKFRHRHAAIDAGKLALAHGVELRTAGDVLTDVFSSFCDLSPA